MQSIIRHNHSEMNEFSGLLRIIIYSALDCLNKIAARWPVKVPHSDFSFFKKAVVNEP